MIVSTRRGWHQRDGAKPSFRPRKARLAMRDRDRGPVLFGNLRETPAPSSDEPAITGVGEPIHEASASPNQQPVITVDAPADIHP